MEVLEFHSTGWEGLQRDIRFMLVCPSLVSLPVLHGVCNWQVHEAALVRNEHKALLVLLSLLILLLITKFHSPRMRMALLRAGLRAHTAGVMYQHKVLRLKYSNSGVHKVP